VLSFKGEEDGLFEEEEEEESNVCAPLNLLNEGEKQVVNRTRLSSVKGGEGGLGPRGER
jgi:hypothetical protein